MNKYEMIYESICNLYDRGILTEEEADALNDLAYEYTVSSDNKTVDLDDSDYKMSDATGKKINKKTIAGITALIIGASAISTAITKFVLGNKRYAKNLEIPELKKLVDELAESKKRLAAADEKYDKLSDRFETELLRYNRLAEVLDSPILSLNDVDENKLSTTLKYFSGYSTTSTREKENSSFNPAKARMALNIIEELSKLYAEMWNAWEERDEKYKECVMIQNKVTSLLRMSKEKFEKSRDKLDSYKLSSKEYKKACDEHDAIIKRITRELDRLTKTHLIQY